ncbi:MAG: hypothetical protein HY741_25520, partial [Chloroflexi bacterium]|nr:hypothetical protein [Chloroflexota bacterium]
ITTAVHRQPLKVDLFDAKPFEPIGRQSLVVALTFVGGIALSLVFGINPENIYVWQNLFVYGLLGLVPVLVFFLNMQETHNVLARAKAQELEAVERNLLRAMRELMQRVTKDQDTGKQSTEINALALYEQRVRGVRTWTYNTAMLRTLLVSFFIPAGTALASTLLKQLLERCQRIENG